MEQKSVALLPAPFAWIEIPGKGYSVAQYPLTNAQYAPFIAAGGYDQRQWWTDTGWDARQQGLVLDWSTGQGVPTTPWTEPRFWNDPNFNGPDQPVVGVSWHEAVAYCRWLSATTGETIALPTEAQWQYAAQGDDRRTYPWGNEWDCTRCNNSVKPCESNATTPVQQYEGRGDSPFGAVDMAGNVWEWCATQYQTRASEAKGEATNTDSNDDINGDANQNSQPRVIKGGGWFYFSNADCRCAFRYSDVPYASYNFRGFRLARAQSPA